MMPSGGGRANYGPPARSPLPASNIYIGMQAASHDCRILMAGDPLQDVQIDTGVGHPCQGGVRLAEAA